MKRLSGRTAVSRRGMLCGVALVVLAACDAPESRQAAERQVESAQRFRQLLAAARYDSAQALLAPEARRWWGTKEGPGTPWRVAEGNVGPWAAWDEHFRSRKEVVTWRATAHRATLVQLETNDYFQLLERGWVTNEITYFFDEAGLIEGLLVRAVGERPPGRTQEFLEWARTHAPQELEQLMDGDDIDPSGDHPQRTRALLNRWRRDAGLETIE